MSLHLRRVVIIAGAAFVAVLGLILVLGGNGSEITLADGTRLRLVGVSVGTNEFTTERPWSRAARQILPRRFQERLPRSTHGACYSTNGIAIWLEDLAPGSRTNVVRKWGSVETVSRNGDVLTSQDAPGHYSGGGRCQPVFLSKFPRRQKSFLLRLYDQKGQLAGELTVVNPCRGPFPQWKAETPPVTKTNGDLTATFKGWKRLLEESPPGRTNQNLKADFEFKWAGAPTTEWELGPCRLDDATGNSVGGLCPELPLSEPVWRLHGWFERRREAVFAPDEHFVFTNLNVLSAGSFTNLNLATNLQGVGLWILWWSGPATLTLSNGFPVRAEPTQGTNAYRQLSLKWANGTWREVITVGRSTLLIAQTPAGLDVQVDCMMRDSNGRATAPSPDVESPQLC